MAERGHTFATKEQQEEAERFTIDSAFMIAHERALETERGDQALVKDPFARQLAGEKGAQLSDSFGMYFKPLGFKEWPEFHKTWTVVRSKYIDDLIDNLATEGCGLHMVNLGAGVDTRVLRLESYRHFSASYEVELEAQNEAKVATFATLEATPKCPQVLVSVNLLDASALASALAAKGFDQTKPSVFLAEGLIQYLKGDEAGFISSVSSVAASGSTLSLQ
jgi:methyltransferase (TIGR00027 family)